MKKNSYEKTSPKLLEATKTNIIKAAAAINRAELVVFPTETVYGLGADATNDEAVAKIYTAKGLQVGLFDNLIYDFGGDPYSDTF